MRIFNKKSLIIIFTLLFLVTFSSYFIYSNSNFELRIFEEHQTNEIYQYIDYLEDENEVGFYEVVDRDSQGDIVSLKIYLVNSDGFEGSDILLDRRRDLGLDTDDINQIKENVYLGLDDYILHIFDKDRILTDKDISFCLNDYQDNYQDFYSYLRNFNLNINRNCNDIVLINISNDGSFININHNKSNIIFNIGNETSRLELKDELVELFSKSLYVPRGNRAAFELEEDQYVHDGRIIFEYNYNSYHSDDLIFNYERFSNHHNINHGFSGVISFPDYEKEKVHVYKDDKKSIVSYHEDKSIESLFGYSRLSSSTDDVKVKDITSLFINLISYDADHYLPSVLVSNDPSTGHEFGTFAIYSTINDNQFDDFESFYNYMTSDYSRERVSPTLNRLRELENDIQSLNVPYIGNNQRLSGNINSLCDTYFSGISKCKVDSDFNFLEFIYDIAQERDICPISILAFMATESTGRWEANSQHLGGTHSLGLMQISGIYAEETPLKSDSHDLRIHPTMNIIYGADYIAQQRDRYHYLEEEKSRYFFGAMSYNLGPAYVINCASNYKEDINRIYSCVIRNAYYGYDKSQGSSGRDHILIKNNELNTIKGHFDRHSKVYEGGSFGYKVMGKYDFMASLLGVKSNPSLSQFKRLYNINEQI